MGMPGSSKSIRRRSYLSESTRQRGNFKEKVYPTVVNVALKALHDYRLNYGSMLFEVYFPFPLLLSQLVTIVVYSYFVVALFAQQNLNTETIFSFQYLRVVNL